MFNLLRFAMYRSMSFELKCTVNSVAMKLMLAPFIAYSLSAVLACQHGGVNRMGHVTAGALLGMAHNPGSKEAILLTSLVKRVVFWWSSMFKNLPSKRLSSAPKVIFSSQDP